MTDQAAQLIRQMQEMAVSFERKAEAERLIIFCHPSQHKSLLKELNRILDRIGQEQFFTPRAALVPNEFIQENMLAVTRRKYLEWKVDNV